jgi:hypothetical protein
MRWLSLVLVAAVVGCSDSGGPDDNGLQINGTWAGDYTNTVTPGVIYEAVLQLDQEGTQVTGFLTSNAGRSANIVNGAVDDANGQFTATFEFTDECGGIAETSADIVDGASRLVGNYTMTDCNGSSAGGYNLARQ